MASFNKCKVKKLYLPSAHGTRKGFGNVPTLVTATADEMNKMAGVTSTAAELNLVDGSSTANATVSKAVCLDAGGNIITASSVGTAGTLSTATEYGTAFNHMTRIAVTAGDFAVKPPGADAEATGLLVYTFPATGDIMIKRAWMNIGLTGSAGVAADEPDVGLGSVTATGDVATLDGTGTFEDIITGQTWSTGKMAGVTQIAGVAQTLVMTKGATNKVHINVADTWAAASPVFTATGIIFVEWDLFVY